MKERADRLMVAQGLAESRQKAQALIMAGLVYSKDQKIDKPGQLLKEDQSLDLKETLPYVSRGGLKLEAALEGFQLSVTGKVAVDLGASTGGFTDCLLQRGACKVYAVDVDTRQLDWGLRQDPRVVLIQKNARYLQKRGHPGKNTVHHVGSILYLGAKGPSCGLVTVGIRALGLAYKASVRGWERSGWEKGSDKGSASARRGAAAGHPGRSSFRFYR